MVLPIYQPGMTNQQRARGLLSNEQWKNQTQFNNLREMAGWENRTEQGNFALSQAEMDQKYAMTPEQQAQMAQNQMPQPPPQQGSIYDFRPRGPAGRAVGSDRQMENLQQQQFKDYLGGLYGNNQPQQRPQTQYDINRQNAMDAVALQGARGLRANQSWQGGLTDQQNQYFAENADRFSGAVANQNANRFSDPNDPDYIADPTQRAAAVQNLNQGDFFGQGGPVGPSDNSILGSGSTQNLYDKWVASQQPAPDAGGLPADETIPMPPDEGTAGTVPNGEVTPPPMDPTGMTDSTLPGPPPPAGVSPDVLDFSGPIQSDVVSALPQHQFPSAQPIQTTVTGVMTPPEGDTGLNAAVNMPPPPQQQIASDMISAAGTGGGQTLDIKVQAVPPDPTGQTALGAGSTLPQPPQNAYGAMGKVWNPQQGIPMPPQQYINMQQAMTMPQQQTQMQSQLLNAYG